MAGFSAGAVAILVLVSAGLAVFQPGFLVQEAYAAAPPATAAASRARGVPPVPGKTPVGGRKCAAMAATSRGRMLAALAKSGLALTRKQRRALTDICLEAHRVQTESRLVMANMVVNSIRDTWKQVGLSMKLDAKEAKLVKLALKNVKVLRREVGALEAVRDGLTLREYDTRLQQLISWSNIWSKGATSLRTTIGDPDQPLRVTPGQCVREIADSQSIESLITTLRLHKAREPKLKLGELVALLQASARDAMKERKGAQRLAHQPTPVPGGARRLLAAKEIGAPGLDRGTALQMRVSFHVGNPDAPGPVLAHVERTGDFTRGPELLLWLIIRTVGDVDGLHTRSGQVMGLGVEDYLRVFGERGAGGADKTRTGKIWAQMSRSIRLTPRQLPTVDCAVATNLIGGGASGLKWLGMVHLQGSVGDIAQLYAPWLIWDYLDKELPAAHKAVVRSYIKKLAAHPGHGRFRSPLEAAQWVERVVKAAGR